MNTAEEQKKVHRRRLAAGRSGSDEALAHRVHGPAKEGTWSTSISICVTFAAPLRRSLRSELRLTPSPLPAGRAAALDESLHESCEDWLPPEPGSRRPSTQDTCVNDLIKSSYKDFAAFLCARDQTVLSRITETEVVGASRVSPWQGPKWNPLEDVWLC